VFANRLDNRQDMGLGERAVQRCAAMTAGAERDQLRGVVEVRPALVVVAFELFQVDPQLGGSGAAGKFMRRRHKSKSNRWCGRQSNPCRPVVAMAGAGEKPGPARQGRVRRKICGTRWNLGGTRPYLTSGCASAWQCANARNRPAATTAVLRLARFRSL